MGREQFARMKPTAFFVTTARGPVHDEDALHDALVGGTIAGAGIDVFHRRASGPAAPVVGARQRRRQPAHRGDHGRGDARHRVGHRRPVDHDLRGQAAAPPDQPRGVADLLRPIPCPLRRAARGAECVTTRSAKVREQLDHPVIDADGHWVELFPVYFDYIAEVGSPAHVDTVPHPVRAPVPRLVRAHRRGAAATAPAPPVVLGRAGQRPGPRRHRHPGPLLRPPRRLGHRPGDRVPEHRADPRPGHRRSRARQRGPPGLQHDGRGPVLAVPRPDGAGRGVEPGRADRGDRADGARARRSG